VGVFDASTSTAPSALIKVPMSSMLTVWYNTKCPVCTAGVEWQHRRLVRAARAGVSKSRPTGRNKTRPLCGMGVRQDAPRPPRRRWPGFRSRGGRGFQEAMVISPVSGSAIWSTLLFYARPAVQVSPMVTLAPTSSDMPFDMISVSLESASNCLLRIHSRFQSPLNHRRFAGHASRYGPARAA
jgi:hypothetical protein